MTKKALNQNSKYAQKLIDIIEPDFNFSDKPINRMKITNISENITESEKSERLNELKEKINSIENCKLKNNSRNLNRPHGVGLGLSIASDLIKIHGGNLHLKKSQDLGGLKASLTLPL